MGMRIQHADGEYKVVVSPEAMKAMKLEVGTEVNIVLAPKHQVGAPISADEAIASYLRTEPFHRETYTELAK